MAMGRRRHRQRPMWIATEQLPHTRGHVFYDAVNEILKAEGFDGFVEQECVHCYKSETIGRPSIAPGVYFRMVVVGYFEGIDSERGIAWRCADSLSLKSFLGYALTETTPIVRRDTGEGYTEFLTKLAKASGIETPTREELAKL